eukprot:4066639-Prymnesium_polylepis.1
MGSTWGGGQCGIRRSWGGKRASMMQGGVGRCKPDRRRTVGDRHPRLWCAWGRRFFLPFYPIVRAA